MHNFFSKSMTHVTRGKKINGKNLNKYPLIIPDKLLKKDLLGVKRYKLNKRVTDKYFTFKTKVYKTSIFLFLLSLNKK